MEKEIYQILKKHKLPLKKREEVLTDLLLLFSVSGSSSPDDFWKQEYDEAVKEIGDLQDQLKNAESALRDMESELRSQY